MNRILEFYGESTRTSQETDWLGLAMAEHCPFLTRKCIKIRKSQPEKTIGTCTVEHGREHSGVIICPHRLLERNQIFTDCLHLLTLHEPGNTLHIVPEISIPGGNVDYFLVSARGKQVKDFVGLELQTLDTTGTLWPERQKFLREQGFLTSDDSNLEQTFGMNWKMTAKTILVQLHHKVETFESIHKHLVLVLQDHLLAYMKRAFDFAHVEPPKIGNSMQLHSYGLTYEPTGRYTLNLQERFSTDARGVAKSLGLQQRANIELDTIVNMLESKLSDKTILSFQRS